MNPEQKIKQLLDEAVVETGGNFDQHLLDDAWQGSYRSRRLRTIIVTVAASLVAFWGGWWIRNEFTPKQPLRLPLYTQASLCELMSSKCLNQAWQQDQWSGLNRLMDQVDQRSGPRPGRLTVDDILNECDEL